MARTRRKGHERNAVIFIALGGNVAIALSKFFAAAYTGSSAMASEGVHSLVDTSNELLLLYGLRRSRAPSDVDHPFGYGREVYVWSFIVALMIFAVGATASAYEGIQRLRHPEPMRSVAVNLIVIAVAFVFEGISWLAARRHLKKERLDATLIGTVRKSKDPSTFAVFLEDSAALLGLVVAAAGVVATHVLDSPIYDALASIAIAVLLAIAALFLGNETKELLIGEQAHSEVRKSLLEIATQDTAVAHANGVVTAQMGPDRVLAALSVEFDDGLKTPEIENCVKRLEDAIRKAFPEVYILFVKPQTQRTWERRRKALLEDRE
jgi:cation diffusion facilitator family transporter